MKWNHPIYPLDRPIILPTHGANCEFATPKVQASYFSGFKQRGLFLDKNRPKTARYVSDKHGIEIRYDGKKTTTYYLQHANYPANSFLPQPAF